MQQPANKWYVIVNPVAGFGKGIKKWNELIPLMQGEFEFDVVFTERDKHAVSLAREAIEAGYTNLLAIGGDGTLHQVVNGLMTQQKRETSDITIAFFSCGTGNDWVRSFNFPTKNEELIALLKKKKTILQDIGKVTCYENKIQRTEYFNNIAGVGFDAYVIQQTRNKTTGQFSYLIGMLKSVFSYQCNHLRIKINGETHDAVSYLTLAAINKYAGGGMRLAPNAINNDGLFDVVLVREMSKWEVVKHTPKLFSGKYIHLPQVSVFRTSSFEIEAMSNSGSVYCEADGELIGTGPFCFSILANALKIIVP